MGLLSLSDITNIFSVEKEEYIDMTDFYIEDYENILLRQKPISKSNWDITENITVLDLFNIPYEGHDEIKEFIINRLWINIDTKEWIDEINILLGKAIELYENRYLRNLPLKIKKLNFKRAEGIINFLKETKSNKKTWILNCAIAKICYAVDDILSNEKIHRAEFIDKKFIEKYLEKPFQITDSYEKQGIIYRKWKVVISDEIIEFTLISRCKSEQSIQWKQIADPKYYSVEEFKDLVWVTIYTKTDKETLLLLQYLDSYVFKWNAEIDNKNGISEKTIVKNRTFLHKEFFWKVIKCMSKEDKWKGSSEDYKEIKLRWITELPLEEWENSALFNIWTEIKIVIKGQDNEKWLALHAIYDYLKRFRELTRLWLPIRRIDIVNFINDFFTTINDKLESKNKTLPVYRKELYEDLYELWFIDKNFTYDFILSNPEELSLWLYKYFKSNLIKVKIWQSKKEYYFCKRALSLSELWLHKKLKKVD